MRLGVLIAGVLALYDLKNVKTDHMKPLLFMTEADPFQTGKMTTSLSIQCVVFEVFILIVASLELFDACCQKCMLVVVSIYLYVIR